LTADANQRLSQAASSGDLAGADAALTDGADAALTDGADVNARGQFGDTALNQAAENGHLEVVKRLVAAGADLENKGGADKTPLMNAAFAGHLKVVQFLLENDARVSDDLLSSLQLKVNILAENAEAGFVRPEAAEAWQRFFNAMVAARLRQDWPEILAGLSAADGETRALSVERVISAAKYGVDVAEAKTVLQALLTDEDQTVRELAAEAVKQLQV
jgi:ankyrin repeat protein